MNNLKILSAVLLLGAITGCGPAADEACAPDGQLGFVCGPRNAEDLVRVPGTAFILSGGMVAGAGFYSIDSATGSWSGLDFVVAQDRARFPSCPMAPARTELEIHGLNIRQGADNRTTLYAVAHGGREAIEVFDVGSGNGAPSLTWVGCVEMPDGLPANSVASGADGSLPCC